MGNTHSAQIIPSNSVATKFAIGIIDVQNDFCKGGKLAVEEADHAIGAINKLRYIYDDYTKCFISQDWHNENHMSFASRHGKAPNTGPFKLNLQMEDGSTIEVDQMMWPKHCVENTTGSLIHRDLIVTKNDKIIKKGTKVNVESYSAFGDAMQGKYEKTQLHDWLQLHGITDIILTGIATDYCVYNTALDALRLGYKVHLIYSCTRGVAKDSIDKAYTDMKTKGVTFYKTVDEFHDLTRNTIVGNDPIARYTPIK